MQRAIPRMWKWRSLMACWFLWSLCTCFVLMHLALLRNLRSLAHTSKEWTRRSWQKEAKATNLSKVHYLGHWTNGSYSCLSCLVRHFRMIVFKTLTLPDVTFAWKFRLSQVVEVRLWVRSGWTGSAACGSRSQGAQSGWICDNHIEHQTIQQAFLTLNRHSNFVSLLLGSMGCFC